MASATIYLDHNATTPLADSVLVAMTTSMSRDWANPGSAHAPGRVAHASMVQARMRVADMLGARPGEIVFTSGGTEASNMVLLGVPQLAVEAQQLPRDLGSQPHVVTSNVEHDATILPLRRMELAGLVAVTEVAVDARGALCADAILSALRPTTRLVTLMLANNETGVIFPVKEIASRLRPVNAARLAAHAPPVLLHTDAAQAIGKVDVDVIDLGVDYLTLTGHKFYGPRFGCVYARDLDVKGTPPPAPLHPLLLGGGQEGGLRGGTPNVVMIVGLGEAARLVEERLAEFKDKMGRVRDLMEQQLELEFGDRVVFNCRHPDVPTLANTSNISLLPPDFGGQIDGVGDKVDLRGHSVLSRCPGVLASVGACCHEQSVASTVLIRCGVSPSIAANAIRLSVGRNTTNEQVLSAVKQLKQTYDQIVGSDRMP